MADVSDLDPSLWDKTRDLTPDECQQYLGTSTCPKLP